MNIIQAHTSVEGMLDRYRLPLISRTMMDNYLRTSLYKAIGEILGDQGDASKTGILQPQLSAWTKQQLKEYLLEASAPVVPAAGNYLNHVIAHGFRYLFDVRVTVNGTTEVAAIPSDYQELDDLLSDPFDKPTMTHPERIYCSLAGTTLVILKPSDCMITSIRYHYISNPVVFSGQEIVAGDAGGSADRVLVCSDTALYGGILYEKGALISGFSSAGLTSGSVVKNYADLLIPAHLESRVIAEAALLIESFFSETKK